MYLFINDISDDSSDTVADISRCVLVSFVAKRKSRAIIAKAMTKATTTVQASAEIKPFQRTLLLIRKQRVAD